MPPISSTIVAVSSPREATLPPPAARDSRRETSGRTTPVPTRNATSATPRTGSKAPRRMAPNAVTRAATTGGTMTRT